jgi:hypothetical protein
VQKSHGRSSTTGSRDEDERNENRHGVFQTCEEPIPYIRPNVRYQ